MEHSDQQLDEWARSLEEAIFIEDLRDLRDLRDKGYGLLHPGHF